MFNSPEGDEMVFIAFDHRPVVEECKGCGKVCHDWCVAYTNPEAKWKNGRCPLCSTPQTKEQTVKGKKLNPLKASAGKGGLRPYLGKKGKYEKSWEDRTAGRGK